MADRAAFVVLTGGESRRMGRDKAFLEVGGREMLHRLVEVGTEATSRVVVAGRDPDRLARALARYGRAPDGDSLLLATDRRPGAGPLAGLEAGLRAAGTGRCFVAACDVPLLGPEVVRALLAELRELEGAPAEGPLAAVPRLAGRPQPLAAAYSAGAAGAARACLERGERSMSVLLDRLEVRWVPADRLEAACGAPGGAARRWFLNVNRPGELERARELCRDRAAAAAGRGERETKGGDARDALE